MNTLSKLQMDNRPPKHLRTLKSGHIREDGMVFRYYHKRCSNGEYWVTQEKFQKIKESENNRARQKDNRPPPELRTLKKGDVREDGMIFWSYKQNSPNGERWLSKESYERQHSLRTTQRIKNRKQARSLDPLQRMIDSQRSRIRCAIRDSIKSDRTMDLVGCTPNELKDHIESQFKDGMTFDNYGRGGWVIDHIKPIVSFDLSDPEQQRECFHYTNLQPLWEKENLTKGSSIT
tara:strand:+ start:79 stop:777 length:699 start_codon:yes stop_codon:yes gene_type:complete